MTRRARNPGTAALLQQLQQMQQMQYMQDRQQMQQTRLVGVPEVSKLDLTGTMSSSTSAGSEGDLDSPRSEDCDSEGEQVSQWSARVAHSQLLKAKTFVQGNGNGDGQCVGNSLLTPVFGTRDARPQTDAGSGEVWGDLEGEMAELTRDLEALQAQVGSSRA